MGNYAGSADNGPLECLPHWSPGEPEHGIGAGGGGPLPSAHQDACPRTSGSASYLREILASEESLRAAFEPVLRAARRPGSDAVDREGFACAVNRIVGYFNPSEPIALRVPSFGPPYAEDEALSTFRGVLFQLATRLEELERPTHPHRLRSSEFAGAAATAKSAEPLARPSEDSAEAPSRRAGGPGRRSWQPTATQLPPAAADAPRPAPAVSQRPWSPGPTQRQAPVAAPVGGGDTLWHSAPKLPSSGGGLENAAATAAMTAGPPLQWASLRAPSPQTRTSSALPPAAAGGSGETLGASLEASRARVAGLRRALGREEELLRQQAEETRRLEHLQRDLEAEAEDEPERELRSGPNADPRSLRGVPVDDEELADVALEGPMSLDDVKYHLRTVLRLRRRVVELEGALDGREEQVAVLSDELQRRTAELAARVASGG